MTVRTRLVLTYALAAFMIGSGVLHFSNPAFYLALMPPVLPWHAFLVYASGVAELVFGAMLLLPSTRWYGAWGVIATLIAVYPANIYHAWAGGLSDPALPALMSSAAVAWLRLPVQLVFLAWAWAVLRGSKRVAR